MLDVSPGNLRRESSAAISNTREHLGSYEEMRWKYHSRHYHKRAESAEDTLANHYYDWISYVVNRVIFEEPQFVIESKRGAAFQDDAIALQAALNQLARDRQWRKFLAEGPVLDAQFNFGVAVTTREPVKGARPVESRELDDEGNYVTDDEGKRKTITPHVPHQYRVSQWDYFQDPQAETQDQVRFQGDVYEYDLTDIEAELEADPNSWNQIAVDNLTADTDRPEQRGSADVDRVPRKSIRIRRVWVAEAREGQVENEDGEMVDHPGPAEGFHGTIFYLADDDGAGDEDEVDGSKGLDSFLKDPVPFYGPPSGPYTIFGCHKVPDDALPLGPLTVAEDQVRDLNRQESAMSRSAVDFKRLVFVDKTSPRIVQAVKSAEHHYVVPIKGFDRSKIHQAELGGLSDNQIACRNAARERLDRVSLPDASRGVVTGRGTATEINEASSSTDTRMSGIEQALTDSVIELARKALWYLYHDNTVYMPLGSQAVKELDLQPEVAMDEDGWPVIDEDGNPQMVEQSPVFQGGQADQIAFHELGLVIETDSMKRSERGLQQQMSMQGLNTAIGWAQMIPLMPFIEWKQAYAKLGHVYNDPSLATIVDVDKALNQPPTLDPASSARLGPPPAGRVALGQTPASGSSPGPGGGPSFGEGAGAPGAFGGNQSGGMLSSAAQGGGGLGF